MFFDPSCKPEVERPCLAGFIAYAEREPTDREYDWFSAAHCVVGEYLIARFGKLREKENGNRIPFADACDGAENYRMIGQTKPWTYGAALQRAKALLVADRREAHVPDRLNDRDDGVKQNDRHAQYEDQHA
jgi:hypothetical protein